MGNLFEVSNAGLVKFRQSGTEQLVLEKGVAFPVSPAPVDGQVFYRTDSDTLYIYNGTTWVSAGSSATFRVYVETPNETPNGVTTIFTVDNSYLAGTTEVSRNGLRLVLGTDYTESNPATGQITFTTAPSTGADILVSYNRTVGSESPRLVSASYVAGTPSAPYSGSLTVFDLPFTYSTGVGNLLVFSGGVLMTAGGSNDYVETDSDTVTFNSARTTGERISFLKLGISNDFGTPGGWIDDGSTIRLETSTDSVGIGTASPTRKVHIFDNSTSTNELLFIEQDGTGHAKVKFDAAGESTTVGHEGSVFAITRGASQFRIMTASGDIRLDTSAALLFNGASSRFLFSTSFSGSGSFQTPVNTVDDWGSFGANIVTTSSASYSALATDYTILANAASNNITVNLPAASGCTRRIYVIKKTDNSVNTVTVDANSTETIDGALTYVLTAQWESVTIQSNGTSWFVL